MTNAPLLAVRGATRRFGAVTALDDVTFTVDAGEVLAILGDNGAGKSTLIKCISGAHRLHSGTIELDGRPVTISSPAAARALGIETVYQDLALFDNLNPIDNFYAGREVASPRWLPRGMRLLRRREMFGTTEAVVQRLRVGLPDLHGPVGLLSGGQRQAVAVARAAAFASRLVILDEPTAALGVRETGQVLKLIRELRDNGLAIILISHNMPNVFEVADRIHIQRLGACAGVISPKTHSMEDAVAIMTGAKKLTAAAD